ncbi:uncharacterized protein G2W53_024455 [Senna tora]|uniref:Uncharacterized protein n=1 Tax=Senna tora TaxID=362788 RepID=A0A834TC32_9FABA|nr:uncharacterized protein G2W53_024455 [Senna tora]
MVVNWDVTNKENPSANNIGWTWAQLLNAKAFKARNP